MTHSLAIDDGSLCSLPGDPFPSNCRWLTLFTARGPIPYQWRKLASQGRGPIVCGHTDMRCGIDGLASLVSDQYNLALPSSCFVVEKKDRYKALYWNRAGFMLFYKRIENGAPARFISTLSGG